ncbi:MAG TPA: putative DNA-binding protein [Cerasibacillus sp.]|uniref:putative DNA-binding protein n=1 Tax=Cerasibacillus sp. TaxID=2498711 RepID=UPI002F41371C
MLERTTRINFLFDFYHPLLTDKQRIYLQMYYLEDYSLGEISEIHGVSRQAIYDNIKRTEKMLETYEQKLRLYEKFQKRSRLLQELETVVHEKDIVGARELLKQIKDLG